MASLPIAGTEFGRIIARAILKRAQSDDESDTALAAADERNALIGLAKALAQAGKGSPILALFRLSRNQHETLSMPDYLLWSRTSRCSAPFARWV
jgi:hypothetical protein